MQPLGIGRVQNDMQLIFNRFWKPSVSSFYFLYKPNQKHRYIWLYVVVNEKTISTLKYAFLIQIGLIILFCCVKLFISSWSLWSNSTHPDESSLVESSKASRRTKYGNWIRSQAGINTTVESQKQAILVIKSLRYIAWLDEKLNLHEMIKILTTFWKT